MEVARQQVTPSVTKKPYRTPAPSSLREEDTGLNIAGFPIVRPCIGSALADDESLFAHAPLETSWLPQKKPTKKLHLLSNLIAVPAILLLGYICFAQPTADTGQTQPNSPGYDDSTFPLVKDLEIRVNPQQYLGKPLRIYGEIFARRDNVQFFELRDITDDGDRSL